VSERRAVNLSTTAIIRSPLAPSDPMSHFVSSSFESASTTSLGLRSFALAFATAIGVSACSSDSTSWARGDHHEIKTYTSVEFRRGPMNIDPRTGELSIAWAGARAPEGYPRILECHLYVFDDKNGNGAPDPGEVLQERSSRELCRKVMFDDIRVVPAQATGTLMAQIALHTERRYRSVSWKLVPD
jgi:hypothetical protein